MKSPTPGELNAIFGQDPDCKITFHHTLADAAAHQAAIEYARAYTTNQSTCDTLAILTNDEIETYRQAMGGK